MISGEELFKKYNPDQANRHPRWDSVQERTIWEAAAAVVNELRQDGCRHVWGGIWAAVGKAGEPLTHYRECMNCHKKETV